jgi:DNA polymerase III delta prime subunit
MYIDTIIFIIIIEMQNINELLNRNDIETKIKNILNTFQEKCYDASFKKGFYIYGAPGTGKTQFVNNILKDLGYDVIKYDAGDIRNRSLIDTITSNNVSTRNVLDMMYRKETKIAIVMDEIDGMNSGDKGGITALIKLIRQKKTKKQKLENVTLNPIICIGNYYSDKKMKELMKVCNSFELKTATDEEMHNIIGTIIPSGQINPDIMNKVLKYIQGDLRKLNFIKKICSINNNTLDDETMNDILHTKFYNEDSKQITKQLINNKVSLDMHNNFMNETDRTIVALLWHENIIDMLNKNTSEKSIPLYLKILNNFCFSDYMDRITFQHQIWQFNEMSSMNKTFHSNYIYHENLPNVKNKFKPVDIRFTKVLTKYSTEYNNQQFIFTMCQKLDMDRRDICSFFEKLRYTHGDEYWESNDNESNVAFNDLDISKLDIRRIYRYIDKNE